jgi:hypothetical protein
MREMWSLDEALDDLGGVRVVVEGMLADDVLPVDVLRTLGEIAPDARIPKSVGTITNWVVWWEREDARAAMSQGGASHDGDGDGDGSEQSQASPGRDGTIGARAGGAAAG